MTSLSDALYFPPPMAGREPLPAPQIAARMREKLRQYGDDLAMPRVVDIVLPAWLPAPSDFARWRFRRRWLGLIEEIVAARQAKTAAGGELHDLLDLMVSDPETGRPVS